MRAPESRGCSAAPISSTQRTVFTGYRFRNIPAEVGRIVLVALDIGLHVFRRHQPHPVAKFREFTRPIMSRGAGFHADKASRQRLEELQHLAAPQLLTDDDFSAASMPWTWNTFLAISKPIVVTCMWTAP